VKRVDIVCYTSKLCNLRCKYCYEGPMLSDKRRMSHESIERMFESFAEYYATIPERTLIRFQWHGGEPLLIEPEFYYRAFELQQRVFAGTHHKVTNIVQTNMTVLDEARIALLRDGFDEAGVSLDLFSGLRVNKRGLCVQNKAIKNLDTALAAGVQLSGITVLTRALIERIPEVYRFWRDRRLAFRLLPVESGLYESGQGFEITAKQTLGALCTLADQWLADDDPVSVEPLSRVLYLLMHGRMSEAHRVGVYDKAKWESVVLVDTDGTVYGYADRFEAARSPGNVFQQPFSQLMAHERHQLAVSEANARVAAACRKCEHYGRSCTGDPMGEGENAFTERDEQGNPVCIVTRGFIDHLALRLTQAGIIDRATGLLSKSYLQSSQQQEAAL
jgi:uncharacterized protein